MLKINGIKMSQNCSAKSYTLQKNNLDIHPATISIELKMMRDLIYFIFLSFLSSTVFQNFTLVLFCIMMIISSLGNLKKILLVLINFNKKRRIPILI